MAESIYNRHDYQVTPRFFLPFTALGAVTMSATAREIDNDRMQVYLQQGERRALALDNRGPVRYASDGKLAPDILEAYRRYGFYVFQGVYASAELAEIEAEFKDVLARLPTHEGSPVDAQGRPAIGAECSAKTLFWSKPLGDPWGGSDFGSGRHPVQMPRPEPGLNTPQQIVFLIIGYLQYSEAFLRAYGHPDLLSIVAAINGDDFVPHTDALFIKPPRLGASVAWHQDGITHWDSPHWDAGTHGLNAMAQLYRSTPANGVWVVPGTHRVGRIDIKRKRLEAGTELFPDAVPLMCEPGDVVVNNRQLLHGSFANTSDEWRVSLTMGFHRRASVLGAPNGGILGETRIIDASQIEERSRTIGLAIDARRQHFRDETPFAYKPLADAGKALHWDAIAKASLDDYHRMDMSI